MRSNYFELFSLTLLSTSFLLGIYGFFAGSRLLYEVFEGVSSIVFWSSIVSLVFLFPLRNVASLWSKYAKRLVGALIFVSYLAVHLTLYGLNLDYLVAYSYGIRSIVTQLSSSVEFVQMSHVSFISIFINLGFNPTVDILVPPAYVLSFTSYTISMAFVIAILVVANVMRVREIGRIRNSKMSQALVLLPALGVIGGILCCLLHPFLIILSVPVNSIMTSSEIAYYSAYFALPIVTVIVLKYNLDLMHKISMIMKEISLRRLNTNAQIPE